MTSSDGVLTPYATHFIGKWHMGMASKSKQTPHARGFDTSLAYFHSMNNYYNQHRAEGCDGTVAVDLYEDEAPGKPQRKRTPDQCYQCYERAAARGRRKEVG